MAALTVVVTYIRERLCFIRQHEEDIDLMINQVNIGNDKQLKSAVRWRSLPLETVTIQKFKIITLIPYSSNQMLFVLFRFLNLKQSKIFILNLKF